MAQDIRIFYSWQSDLPDNTNRNVIRNSLKATKAKIEESFTIKGISLTLDEATRGVSGSPNIPLEIMKKIEKSDIFIADVSIINSDSKAGRKFPNPNVVFELGFAVAQLGWERIIMLFNSEFGDIGKDLPFDFDRHRVSQYKISGKNYKSDKLKSLLNMAIESIIQNNPTRASDLQGFSIEEQKRMRDISNIKWLLSSIHLPTIDQHILDSPHMILSKVFHFWEGYQSIIKSSLFHLYNNEINDKFNKIYEYWGKTLDFPQYYDSNFDGMAHIFVIPGDLPLTGDKEEAWNSIQNACRELRGTLDSLLGQIREEYLEINIEETNQIAWSEYYQFHKDLGYDTIT